MRQENVEKKKKRLQRAANGARREKRGVWLARAHHKRKQKETGRRRVADNPAEGPRSYLQTPSSSIMGEGGSERDQKKEILQEVLLFHLKTYPPLRGKKV